jgi:hypothetical protein
MGPVSAAKLLEYMAAGLLLPTSTIRIRATDALVDSSDTLTIETALLRTGEDNEDLAGDGTWKRGEMPPVGERRTLPSTERRTLPPPGSSPKSGPRPDAPSAPRSDPNEVLELGVIPSLTGQDSDAGIDRRPLYLRVQNTSGSPEPFTQVCRVSSHSIQRLHLVKLSAGF